MSHSKLSVHTYNLSLHIKFLTNNDLPKCNVKAMGRHFHEFYLQ